MSKYFGVQVGILIGMFRQLVDVVVDPPLLSSQLIQRLEQFIHLDNGSISLYFPDQVPQCITSGNTRTTGEFIQEFHFLVIEPEGDFVGSVVLGILHVFRRAWSLPGFV